MLYELLARPGHPLKPRAAILIGLRITGQLHLEGAELQAPLIADNCYLDNAVNLIAATDQPTLLLTNSRQMTAKQLTERYAKRWLIENQLSAQIRAFHLDALSSQVPLAVDLDATLSVIADSIYRHFALRLTGYQTATPDTIFRHFIKTPGQLHLTPERVEVRLEPRTRTPVLLSLLAGHGLVAGLAGCRKHRVQPRASLSRTGQRAGGSG